jgi:hypothetical protein
MDHSILRLPDPDAPLPYRERRSAVRQKLHTPVYVSFNSPDSGAVVDLSELLDLHEYGFAVQTAIPAGVHKTDLEVNRAVTLCLDLPETRKFVHGSGQVIWMDDVGRAGVRFTFLPDRSRQALKEWLFANLLVASSNHIVRAGQLARQRQEAIAGNAQVGTDAPVLPPERSFESGASASESPKTYGERVEPAWSGQRSPGLPASEPGVRQPLQPVMQPTPSPEAISGVLPSAVAPGGAGYAEVLSALDDLRRQLKRLSEQAGDDPLGVNFDAALHLIAERAMAFTGASGAALALQAGDNVICRASAGEPAPPLGSAVDVSTGLSGECLRNGVVVSCLDTEADPRVDPEICRALGIGSFMAAPIFADFRVSGLIEVFSPYPQTFAKVHEGVLERLAELVPRTPRGRKSAEQKVEPAPVEQAPVHPQPGPVQPEPLASESEPQAKNEVERGAVVSHTEPAVPGPVEEQNAEPILAEEKSEQELDDPGPRRGLFGRFPASHLVLLILVIAVVAMALGYLLAPAIEQHWLRPAQAASGASRAPLAVDRRGHALSLDELRNLAGQGDADAQWQLGVLYHDGEGVPKDDAVAVQWFERAAEQGYVRAQSTLGAYYWAGRGVPQDYSKAYFWSQLALAQGDENSKSRLEGLSAQMTQAQVAGARQQAEAWLRAHNQAANSKSD